jgi:CRP/FNR family transcriptional regulator, anaerobic regulatory protein
MNIMRKYTMLPDCERIKRSAMDKLLSQSLFPSFENALISELEDAEVRIYEAGRQLIRTGEYFRATMLVIKGLVKVYREDEDGNEFFMYYLQPGQACALSIICASRSKTSQVMAVAIQDTEVVVIPLQTVDEWMTKYKSWYRYVQDTYRSRFEELLIVIDHIAFRNMDERLVFYLKRHSDKLKTNIINTSFTDIATDLNSSREVISRLMKKLADKGLVRLHRTHFEIIDLDKAFS